MRLLALPFLCALFASVVAAEAPDSKADSDASEKADVPDPTIFNGIEVPALPAIAGEKFNSTVKEGYWFVKHHSSVIPLHKQLDKTIAIAINPVVDLTALIAQPLRLPGKHSTSFTSPRNLCLLAPPKIAHRPL